MQEERFKLRASVHILFLKEDQLLLSLRKNISSDGLYGVVAGHLDGGESVTQTIIREAREEADVEIGLGDFEIATVCHSLISQSKIEYIQFYVICRSWQGEIKNKELGKCGELKFFPINSLPENMVPYVRDGIEKTLAGVKYYEYGWNGEQ